MISGTPKRQATLIFMMLGNLGHFELEFIAKIGAANSVSGKMFVTSQKEFGGSFSLIFFIFGMEVDQLRAELVGNTYSCGGSGGP